MYTGIFMSWTWSRDQDQRLRGLQTTMYREEVQADDRDGGGGGGGVGVGGGWGPYDKEDIEPDVCTTRAEHELLLCSSISVEADTLTGLHALSIDTAHRCTRQGAGGGGGGRGGGVS